MANIAGVKILILRFSSIGDIVLTTPVIRCLQKKFPDAEIHFATKKSFQSILEHNPYISKLHLLEDSLSSLIAKLKEERFDYVIDLHNNQRTWLIKLQLGVKSLSFHKINFEKWLMVNLKINRLPAKHIVDRYLETCKDLGVVNDGEGLDYFISNHDRVELKETLPAEFQQGYVAWVIGAKQNTKKFPVAKIVSVLKQLDEPVVLMGGKEDVNEANEIVAQLTGNSRQLFNACGKFSLNQSASLLQQSKLVVTNDTGLMHIAAAFKKPILSIWGNTIPEFGMAPYYGSHQIPSLQSQVSNLSCRPCSKLGYSTCPKGHLKCMNEIDEEELLNSINSILQ
jgi:lipopolysaccharide heptosyltransferase II